MSSAISRTVFPSAARTTHASSADQYNPGAVGMRVDIDITAFSGTSITFTIEIWDVAKGAYVTELASAAISATGHTVYHVDPRITAAANVVSQKIMPRRWRITPSGTITSVTYSIMASYVF